MLCRIAHIDSIADLVLLSDNDNYAHLVQNENSDHSVFFT